MHFYLTTYKHQSKYTIEEIVELIKKNTAVMHRLSFNVRCYMKSFNAR